MTSDAEITAELRATLFERRTSLVASGLLIFPIAIAATIRHPTVFMIGWASLDGTLLVTRIGLMVAFDRCRARAPAMPWPSVLLADLIILSGLTWDFVLGVGTGQCLATNDPAVAVLGSITAMAVVGAQCSRIPGAPRLVALKYILIMLPFFGGGLLAQETFTRLSVGVMPLYLLGIISINRQLHRDYLEMIEGRQESQRIALRCPLTDLPNRRAFDRLLIRKLARMHDEGSRLFLLCLDLDGFKDVNDHFGHPAGDQLLTLAARRLNQQTGDFGTVARLGGDEFGVILEVPNADSAEFLARKIIAAFREPFDLANRESVRIGVSIGISTGGKTGMSPDTLLKEADFALYAAKRSGKNTVCHSAQSQP